MPVLISLVLWLHRNLEYEHEKVELTFAFR
ncbi:MAG: hypothetical protein ACI936_002157 [Paraglaciecola sp.]|jgi:hypothetical protein